MPDISCILGNISREAVSRRILAEEAPAHTQCDRLTLKRRLTLMNSPDWRLRKKSSRGSSSRRDWQLQRGPFTEETFASLPADKVDAAGSGRRPLGS